MGSTKSSSLNLSTFHANEEGSSVVATTPSQLGLDRSKLKYGQLYQVTIKSRYSGKSTTVKFRVNRRALSTLTTSEWPSQFKSPGVGSPVSYVVTNVRKLASA
jgi:hypothetical protein